MVVIVMIVEIDVMLTKGEMPVDISDPIPFMKPLLSITNR